MPSRRRKVEPLSGSVAERIARIEDACASPLGFRQRGVGSWERDLLLEWRGRSSLTYAERAKLMEIEMAVFGFTQP